jgi:hypothetical protein
MLNGYSGTAALVADLILEGTLKLTSDGFNAGI